MNADKIDKFIESITLPIQNPDYLYLYNQLRKKISYLLKEFNNDLEEEVEKESSNKALLKQIYLEVIDYQKQGFNPFFNEGKISVTSMKEFFEIIKGIVENNFSTTPDDLIDACDEFFEKYNERINSRVGKVLQRKKIEEEFDIDKLKETKLTASELKTAFNLSQNKEEFIKNVPFKTSVENFDQDLKNYLTDLDKKIKIVEKLSKEIQVEKVLGGLESYKEFKERIENLKTQKEVEYKNTQNKEILKEIEYIDNSIKNIESAFSSKEIKEVLKDQLIKNVEQIKDLDKNIIKEFIKETQKESENQEKILKVILEKLGTTEKDKELKEQLIYLEKMYKLQKEKREEEIAIKNIEKAKNEYVTPQSFEKMLNETQNIKNVEEDKNNSSSSFSYRDYFYNLSKKYFTKLENSKVGIAVSQGINKVNQKISLLKNNIDHNLLESKNKINKKLLEFKDRSKQYLIKNNLSKKLLEYKIGSSELETIPKKIPLLINKIKDDIDKSLSTKNSSMLIDKIKNKVNESILIDKINKSLSTKNSSISIDKIKNKVNESISSQEINTLTKKDNKAQTQNLSKTILNQNIAIPKLKSTAGPIEQNLNAIAKELGILAYIEREKYEDSQILEDNHNLEDTIKKAFSEGMQILKGEQGTDFDLDIDFNRDRNSKKTKKRKKPRKNKRPNKSRKPGRSKISRLKNVFKRLKNLKKIKDISRIFNGARNIFTTSEIGAEIFGAGEIGAAAETSLMAGASELLLPLTAILAGGAMIYNGTDEKTAEHLGIKKEDITFADRITSGAGFFNTLIGGNYKEIELGNKIIKHNYINKFEEFLGIISPKEKQVIESMEYGGLIRISTIGNSKVTQKGWEFMPFQPLEDIKALIDYNDWDDETKKRLIQIYNEKKKDPKGYIQKIILERRKEYLKSHKTNKNQIIQNKILQTRSKNNIRIEKDPIRYAKKEALKKQIRENLGLNDPETVKKIIALTKKLPQNQKFVELANKTIVHASESKVSQISPVDDYTEESLDTDITNNQKNILNNKVKTNNIHTENVLTPNLNIEKNDTKKNLQESMPPIINTTNQNNTTIIQNMDTESIIFGIL
jgi:hypothetical protein